MVFGSLTLPFYVAPWTRYNLLALHECPFTDSERTNEVPIVGFEPHGDIEVFSLLIPRFHDGLSEVDAESVSEQVKIDDDIG